MRLKNGVIGSMKPVMRDEYYEAKRAAGLIGPPEQYGNASAESIEAYIESVLDANV